MGAIETKVALLPDRTEVRQIVADLNLASRDEVRDIVTDLGGVIVGRMIAEARRRTWLLAAAITPAILATVAAALEIVRVIALGKL